MIIPPYVAGGRLLDAGCGAGEFLVLARSLGWKTVGLEVDPRGVEQARRLGLEVVSSGMEDCPLEDASFDTVVLNHTLEHCYDPNRVLAHCHRVLRRDGLLIAGVPNFACYDNRIFQDCWGHCEAPRHLYHFTPNTLTTMLHRHGFALERLRFKKWFIPHSERINFRFLRRKLEDVSWLERTKQMISTRARVQVFEKLAKLTRLMSDADAASMMTAYARKR
jgi:SAM-dependent methyltransferase